MLKKVISNSLYSFLLMVLMSLIFTFVGFLIIDLFKPLILILLSALLYFGYCIGHKLHYIKGVVGLVSIVILPIFMFVAFYVLCIVGIPFISMMIQYPAAVLTEIFNDVSIADNNPVLFFVIAFVNYLIYSLSLFMGAYQKQKIKR